MFIEHVPLAGHRAIFCSPTLEPMIQCCGLSGFLQSSHDQKDRFCEFAFAVQFAKHSPACAEFDRLARRARSALWNTEELERVFQLYAKHTWEAQSIARRLLHILFPFTT